MVYSDSNRHTNIGMEARATIHACAMHITQSSVQTSYSCCTVIIHCLNNWRLQDSQIMEFSDPSDQFINMAIARI